MISMVMHGDYGDHGDDVDAVMEIVIMDGSHSMMVTTHIRVQSNLIS